MKFINKILFLLILFPILSLAGCVSVGISDLIESEQFLEKLSGAPDYSYQKAYWVSESGNNVKENGSEEKPFRSINYALSQCTGGETILISEGTYTEEVRVEHPSITLRAVDKQHVIIKNTVDNEEEAFAIWLHVDSSGSKLQNLEIIGGYYYGIKIETKWDWGLEDNSGASDIIIENCVIHDTGRDCIKITPNCNNITIRRCEIYNSGIGPANINVNNAEGIDNVNGDNMIVQDCYIHDISTTGIYFKGGAQNCIVERNLIKHTGFSGVLIGFDTSPEYFDLDENPNYYESINSFVRNNVIMDTVYAGIGLYSSLNAKVLNNTIINTARVSMSPICFGLSFQDWEKEAKRPPNKNPGIYNNLIYQEDIANEMMLVIRYSDELGGMSALEGHLVMDYNCYFSNGEMYFRDKRPDSKIYTDSFSEWQVHLDTDRHSFIENPLLVEEYHLSSNSISVDNGCQNSFVTYDVDEKQRDKAFDIGAWEYSD